MFAIRVPERANCGKVLMRCEIASKPRYLADRAKENAPKKSRLDCNLRAPIRVFSRMKMPDKPRWSGETQEQIDEAIRRGEFDNLQGKGQPLKLWGDLAERRVMRAKLSQEDRQTAPWDDAAREIDSLSRRAESEIKRALEFRRAGLVSKRADPAKIESDFRAQIRAVQTTIAAANSQILRHNLLIPTALPRLHRPRLKLGELMARLAPEVKNYG